VNDEQKDTIFTKQFKAVVQRSKRWDWSKNELVLQANRLWFVENVWQKFRNIVALGWGILDGLTVMPLYRCFLITFIEHGWAIILFTLIKLAMSPITYKSFCHKQNESIDLKLMSLEKIQ
jgi:hypothetical protein